MSVGFLIVGGRPTACSICDSTMFRTLIGGGNTINMAPFK